MKWLKSFINRITGWDKVLDEAWDRFIVPQIERARDGGIPDDRIGEMLREAHDNADFVAHFPGTIMRDLVTQELDGGA